MKVEYPNYTNYTDDELEALDHQTLVNLVQAKTDTVEHLSQCIKAVKKSRKNVKKKLSVVVEALRFIHAPASIALNRINVKTDKL